tara:strand:+ start:953 stop:1063 length:111 start_codon:yes stop_codon:yes gene_type:complete
MPRDKGLWAINGPKLSLALTKKLSKSYREKKKVFKV